MKELFTKIEFETAKYETKLPLQCYNCNKTFFNPKKTIIRIYRGKRKGGKYCSRQCRNIGAKTGTNFNCHICNKEFYRTLCNINPKGVQFCSSSCSAKYNNAQRTKTVEISCEHCNNKFEVKIGKKKYPKYCSNKCLYEHKTFILVESGKASKYPIKKYLLKTRGDKCEICGISDWCGKPMVKIMDHIDGNANNNDLSNLRLICSNCDTQLPTYKSKNKGSGRHYRRERYKNNQSY